MAFPQHDLLFLQSFSTSLYLILKYSHPNLLLELYTNSRHKPFSQKHNAQFWNFSKDQVVTWLWQGLVCVHCLEDPVYTAVVFTDSLYRLVSNDVKLVIITLWSLPLSNFLSVSTVTAGFALTSNSGNLLVKISIYWLLFCLTCSQFLFVF